MATLTKDEMIAAIKEMSVLDLAELVKAVEEEFGVSAAAPMAVAAARRRAQWPLSQLRSRPSLTWC